VGRPILERRPRRARKDKRIAVASEVGYAYSQRDSSEERERKAQARALAPLACSCLAACAAAVRHARTRHTKAINALPSFKCLLRRPCTHARPFTLLQIRAMRNVAFPDGDPRLHCKGPGRTRVRTRVWCVGRVHLVIEPQHRDRTRWRSCLLHEEAWQQCVYARRDPSGSWHNSCRP
jgi:hypothetical protein